MQKKNTKLIIGLGFESSALVKKAESNAEKFCMDFTSVYYPKSKDLTEYNDNYNLIREDDFWWCGDDIFENLKTPVFKNLIKDKKVIILVVSKMGQKEAGFVDAFIRYADRKKVILIINKNQIEESLYKHFKRKCRIVDTYYTVEYKEKIYDENMNIKPHISILEMQGCLNMSFMKRIEDTVKHCAKGLRRLTQDEKTKTIEDAKEEAKIIIENARKTAAELVSESDILKCIQKEAEKIKADVIAECKKMKEKTEEECKKMKDQILF